MTTTSIYAIGGVPATGKTTLINTILGKTNDWRVLKPYPLVDSLFSPSMKTYIVGKYSPYYPVKGYAQGTDRLSMQVQPSFVKYIQLVQPSRVIFEGDRLFTSSCLKILKKSSNLQGCVLAVTKDELDARHVRRGDKQTEKFLTGRKTKYSNILAEEELKDCLTVKTNQTPKDTELIIDTIFEHLGIENL